MSVELLGVSKLKRRLFFFNIDNVIHTVEDWDTAFFCNAFTLYALTGSSFWFDVINLG